jgi:hypothetical protein
VILVSLDLFHSADSAETCCMFYQPSAFAKGELIERFLACFSINVGNHVGSKVIFPGPVGFGPFRKYVIVDSVLVQSCEFFTYDVSLLPIHGSGRNRNAPVPVSTQNSTLWRAIQQFTNVPRDRTHCPRSPRYPFQGPQERNFREDTRLLQPP